MRVVDSDYGDRNINDDGNGGQNDRHIETIGDTRLGA